MVRYRVAAAGRLRFAVAWLDALQEVSKERYFQINEDFDEYIFRTASFITNKDNPVVFDLAEGKPNAFLLNKYAQELICMEAINRKFLSHAKNTQLIQNSISAAACEVLAIHQEKVGLFGNT